MLWVWYVTEPERNSVITYTIFFYTSLLKSDTDRHSHLQNSNYEQSGEQNGRC